MQEIYVRKLAVLFIINPSPYVPPNYKSRNPYTGTQFVTQAKISCKLLKINNFEHSSDESSKGLKGQFPKIVCPCIYNLIKI